MSEIDLSALPSAHPPGSRFDARCQLCSRVAGQMMEGVFEHHPDCLGTPVFDGVLPRCCECGGRVYLEPTTEPIPTAADREAARHRRGGRWY